MLIPGRDPARADSYTHAIFATEAGDLLHLTDHGHGPMVFEYVRPESPYKVGDQAPHDLRAKPANDDAISWLESAGDALWH